MGTTIEAQLGEDGGGTGAAGPNPALHAERYEIGALLGQGGMARVFAAWDRRLGRRVAVKILHPQLAFDQAFVNRFRREARAAASLSHPGIVQVGETDQDGELRFIVMELVDGQTLAAHLATRGPMQPALAVEVARQVCDALAHAHHRGVVHRDITPSNLILTAAGRVRVVDFGIAQAAGGILVNTLGSTMGTAQYVAPEQVEGMRTDSRSDLYSLGCCLYEMLTGTPPFTGETNLSVTHQHVHTAPVAPSMIRGELPAELDRLVMRALAKRPGERFANAWSMRQALEEVTRSLADGPRTGTQHAAADGAACAAVTDPTHTEHARTRSGEPPGVGGKPPGGHDAAAAGHGPGRGPEAAPPAATDRPRPHAPARRPGRSWPRPTRRTVMTATGALLVITAVTGAVLLGSTRESGPAGSHRAPAPQAAEAPARTTTTPAPETTAGTPAPERTAGAGTVTSTTAGTPATTAPPPPVEVTPPSVVSPPPVTGAPQRPDTRPADGGSSSGVPDVVGQTIEEAAARLGRAGMGTAARPVPTGDAAQVNRVLSQRPAAGSDPAGVHVVEVEVGARR